MNMGNSKELFTSIREAELHQSEEHQNYQVLAYLRGFNTSSGINIPKQNKNGSESLKIRNRKYGN